jgi:hypothetical protein
MVIPSMNVMIGFTYVNIRWLRRYSARKNARPAAPPSSSADWRIIAMSPRRRTRAKARVAVRGNGMVDDHGGDRGSSRQASRASVMISTMGWLSAWSARPVERARPPARCA